MGYGLACLVLLNRSMRVGIDTEDVHVPSEVCEEVRRTVNGRLEASVFAGVADLRLRLRRTQNALLCVAMVGFVGGDLVTSTATSDDPLGAVVDALDALPARIDRLHRSERASADASSPDRHAAVRDELRRLLARTA